jgi:hypothetical protein
MNKTLLQSEQGIPLGNSQEAFKTKLQERNKTMEFRFMERITLHEDHVKNLMVIQSAEFKNLNKYEEVLPFKHSQV